MARKVSKAPETLDFESALKELETIVEQLEAEEIPLDRSLELFERGQKLARRCEHQLKDAENKVRLLLENADGELEEQPLADEADADDKEDEEEADELNF